MERRVVFAFGLGTPLTLLSLVTTFSLRSTDMNEYQKGFSDAELSQGKNKNIFTGIAMGNSTLGHVFRSS